MSSDQPAPKPRKRLPVNPSAEHLRKQAKRRALADSSTLAAAQHRLAREYGSASWPELMRVVETMSRGAEQLSGPSTPREPLPEAANRNDLARVRELLDAGGFTQHDLDLALARAVLRFRERRAIAELLVEHGADPDGQYGSNYGPIVLVTGECLDPDGLEFLLRHGADVTFAPLDSKYGKTSPMIGTLSSYARGANERKHRCIDILLAHGAPVPAEVTPEMLAIHRGDAAGLAALLDREPDLVHRRYPTMPYGNVRLAGGTLLHLAVEFNEHGCIDLLLERGASINARADVIGDLGGQTPIFHVIGTIHAAGLPTLEHLRRAGRWIDRDARARFMLYDEPIPRAMTPLEFAEWTSAEPIPEFRRATAREFDLLRGLARPLIVDPAFAAAVAAIDAGDLDGLRALLAREPRLATARAEETGAMAGPYFAHPALLWFVAENPIRTGKLPANIAAIAQAIIAAGATKADLDYTLGLVCSGLVPRREGRQIELIDALVAGGADPGAGLGAAVQEGERAAARRLLELGGKPDFAAAAGLGDIERMRLLLREDRPGDQARRSALYSAAKEGQVGALSVLVTEAGLPVNTRIGHGNTALHQAAWGGHRAAVDLLLALGADPTLVDGQHNGTPAGWADHAGHEELAEFLRKRAEE